MKKTKKVLCLILALALTLSIMSVGAFAASPKSDDAATAGFSFSELIDGIVGALKDPGTQGAVSDAISGITTGGFDLNTLIDSLTKFMGTPAGQAAATALLDKFGELVKGSDVGTALYNALAKLGTDAEAQALIKDVVSEFMTSKTLSDTTVTRLASALSAKGVDTSFIKNLLEKLGASGTASPSIIDKLKAQFAELGNSASAKFDEILKALNGGSIDSSKLDELLNKLNSADLSKLLGNLDTSALEALLNKLNSADLSKLLGKLDTSALKDLLGKLDTSAIENLLGKLDTSAIENLLGKLDTSALDGLKAKLEALISGSSNSSFKDKLEAILAKLKALMGGEDIEDEETPLAGAVSLNDVDHMAYVQGRGNGKFAPYASLTRGEAAQMIYNLLTDVSREAFYTTSNSFTDVAAGSWYNIAVSTLAAAGAIDGYPDHSFKPDKAITRAEFVKIIVAMYGPVSGATCTFPDVKSGAWYYESAATAQKMGWIVGDNGYYLPNSNMNRASAVTFMNRVLSRVCDTSFVSKNLSSMNSFSDVPVGSWFYAAVMEAANGHDYTKNSNGTETWKALK